MDRPTEGMRITFEGLTRADANRSVEGLRQDCETSPSGKEVERLGRKLAASIEKDDPASQDACGTPGLIFGNSAAVETADGTEIVATGEPARTLDAAALVRGRRGPS